MNGHIPVLDLAPLRTGDPAARQALAVQLREACSTYGFFYITGHAVPPALLADVFAQLRQLFALPRADKLAIARTHPLVERGWEPLGSQVLEPGARPDLKEAFGIGPLGDPDWPNLWPEALPALEPLLMRYFALCRDQAIDLMRLLALSLDLPDDHFDGFCREPLCGLRALRYPPQPPKAEALQRGAGAHPEFGALTLLAQDDAGGLELFDPDAGWFAAEPLPGTMVVNLGDMIPRWTNDRYRSTVHRVINRSGRERYSLPFFFDGNPSARIECLPTCQSLDDPPGYPPISVAEHIGAMTEAVYNPAAV